MSEKLTEYVISADPSKFEAGMKRAEASAASAGESIGEQMGNIDVSTGKVAKAFEDMMGVIGKLTALLAGGALFAAAIDATVDWQVQAKDLSEQLGSTTERASVLMVAMRSLGITSDLLVSATAEITKKIAENGNQFEALGVKVRGAGGDLRPVIDVMADVNAKLSEIENPLDQAIVGMRLYGDGWKEIRETLDLTTEEMAKAEAQAARLNLIVGAEAAAQAKQYERTLADLALVSTSLSVQVGGALLPSVVSLGAWFAEVGPTTTAIMVVALEGVSHAVQTFAHTVNDSVGVVVAGFGEIGAVVASIFGSKVPGALETFRNALKVIGIAFEGLRVAVQLVMQTITGIIEIFGATVMRLAHTTVLALAGDFGGAVAAWRDGTKAIADVTQKNYDQALKIAIDGKNRIDAIALREAPAQQAVRDVSFVGSKKIDHSAAEKIDRMKGWEAQLAIDKQGYAQSQAQQGTAIEYSTAMERDYWERILTTQKVTASEKIGVNAKYFATLAAIRKQDYETEMSASKIALGEYKNNHLARLEIANTIYEQTVARFGREAKEAKEALQGVFAVQQAYAAQVKQVDKVRADAKTAADLAAVDSEQANAEFRLELQQSGDDALLEQQAQFEARRNQIKLAALRESEKTLLGPDQDPIALAQLYAQIEAQETAHQTKMTAIKRKAVLAQNKDAQSTVATIQSGLARVLASTAQGTAKTSDLLRSMLQVVTGAVIDMLAQTAAKWLINTLLGETLAKSSAISQISANAGVAGAAATASAAAIPLYGFAIAPAAGAAASAAALGYLSLASARGGFDIPAGVNPITQLHEKEMVLPAAQADAVRNMADGGGGGGNTINYHDNTGTLSPADIRRNVAVIARALKDYSKKSS